MVYQVAARLDTLPCIKGRKWKPLLRIGSQNPEKESETDLLTLLRVPQENKLHIGRTCAEIT